MWKLPVRGWGPAAVAIVFLAHAVRYFSSWSRGASQTFSDGYYSWLFVRTLVFDHDLDLTNDYAICGDPFHLGVDEGAGVPSNPFYFGPAVFLSPILWVCKHLVRFGPEASDSWRYGCTGPLVFYTGASSIVATTLTVWIGYRIARRWYEEKACAIAVVIMGLASPLNILGTLSWYYSHLWGALAVAICLLCAVRASEQPNEPLRWLEAGLSSGLAALMRMPEGLWMLVAFAAIVSLALRERSLVTALKRSGLLAFGFVAVFGVQLYVFKRLYGSPFVIPQGRLYVQIAHAHPWLLLFGARSGLLYWTPLMWLPLLGIPWFVGRPRAMRALAIAIVFVGCLTFFIASSALSWTGSATLGARIQTSLVPALLPPAAAFLEALIRWTKRHRYAAGTAVALLCAPWIYIGWYAAASGVPNNNPVPAPQLYGSGVNFGISQIYNQIGNPFTFPASAVFFARYRAHPRVLDALASDGMFQHHYRTTALMGSDVLSFASPPAVFWSEHLVPDSSGAKLEGAGRFLVTLYWPWVTSVKLTAKAVHGPVTLRIRAASFFSRTTLAVVTFRGRESIEFDVPPGAFDSGINEVLLSSDGPLVLENWQWVDAGKHDTSTRVFRANASR